MDAAIAALETQLQSQPDDPLVAFMLATYYVQGGEGEKAIPMLDRIATNTVGIFPPPDRFHPIAHLAEYQSVLRQFDASQPPVLRGRVGQGAPAAFNDLVVARDGTVYVTDTASGALYRIRRGGALEAFLPAGTFRGPNGIALSPDEKFAFVAQWRAPVRVELQTGKLTPLQVPAHVVTAGIDGLYFHRGALIGVQNVAHPGRLVRFTLNDAMDAITGAEVLESRNPHFATPTTAAIVGEHAYVLANSYVGWEKDGMLVTGEEMKPTVIVKVPL